MDNEATTDLTRILSALVNLGICYVGTLIK